LSRSGENRFEAAQRRQPTHGFGRATKLNRGFRRQHPFGPYILDNYCERVKVVVEQQRHGESSWVASRGVENLPTL